MYIESTGERKVLVIRRLRCVDCGVIHHELPDILFPYKRYGSESIEKAIENNTDLNIAADESTIIRWREWFQSMQDYLLGCLLSIAIRYGKESVEEKSSLPESKLQRLWQHVGDAPGWLARIVRSISNANLWLHTRSAFLSG